MVEQGEQQGQRILIAIRESGLTQAAIARLMEVSPQAVNNWIKNGRIEKKRLYELCKKLGTGINPAWIVDENQQKHITHVPEVINKLVKRIMQIPPGQMLDEVLKTCNSVVDLALTGDYSAYSSAMDWLNTLHTEAPPKEAKLKGPKRPQKSRSKS